MFFWTCAWAWSLDLGPWILGFAEVLILHWFWLLFEERVKYGFGVWILRLSIRMSTHRSAHLEASILCPFRDTRNFRRFRAALHIKHFPHEARELVFVPDTKPPSHYQTTKPRRWKTVFPPATVFHMMQAALERHCSHIIKSCPGRTGGADKATVGARGTDCGCRHIRQAIDTLDKL